jgi:hypothetical protein
MGLRSRAEKVLAFVQRLSARIYMALLRVLLGVVYALVLPAFALAWRFRARPPVGWQRRDDPKLASTERLRALF